MKELFFKKLKAEDKERYTRICGEVIDLLRKKHELNQFECVYILNVILKALHETLGGLEVESFDKDGTIIK